MKYGLILTCVLALVTSNCATKKFVHNNVDPLAQRVDTLENQNKDQGAAIANLNTAVSDADELAQTADRKSDDAAKQAQSAYALAEKTQQTAANATSVVREGLSELENKVESLNNYRLATQITVLFDLESSKLSEEGKRQLDQAAASMVQDAPCVIEILGYTDTTGSSSYNLTLSEQRAKEVFLYLVGQQGIPLRQIHMVGLGSANPAEDNDTREGRQMNRRVEVRVYIAG
jgi:outer membrane protein OmpA-like peptidoglycan-associated protein